MASPLPRHRPVRALFAVLLVAALGQAGGATAQLDHARDPETVILRLREIHGEVGGPDAGPSVEVRGDGSARVHYPAYLRRAGDYVTRLDAAELERLLAVVAESGLLAFDAAAARRARQAAARAASPAAGGRPETRWVLLDAATTVIELRLGGVERTIRWTGLADDARRYPGVAAIQGLAAAERALRVLMERDDLTRIAR